MLHLALSVVLIYTVKDCYAVQVDSYGGYGGYGGEYIGGKLGGGGIGYGVGEGVGGIGHGIGIGYGGSGLKETGYGYGGGIGSGGLGYEGGGIGYGKGIGYGRGIGYGEGIGYGGIGKGIGGGLDYGEGIGYGGIGKGVGGIGYGGGIGHGGGIGYGGGIGHGGGIGYGGSAGYGGIGKGVGYGYGGGIGSGGYGSGIGLGGGIGGIGLGGKFIGGEEIDKNIYSGGQKNLEGEHFVKSHGNEGGETNHGGAGFTKGETAVKDIKGESAHFSDVDGGKKVIHDGKEYHGGEHFDKEGKQGGEKTVKQGHKKGHNIKGFKSSHQKDESGKTEEYYDEDHDEGGNYGFDGQFGKFGEEGSSSFKGGHEDGKFKAAEAKKGSHYDNEYLVDKAHANQGKFGENKYAGNQEHYGTNKGIDEQDLTGHHQSNKFFKHYPTYY